MLLKRFLFPKGNPAGRRYFEAFEIIFTTGRRKRPSVPGQDRQGLDDVLSTLALSKASSPAKGLSENPESRAGSSGARSAL